jgi:hypothetical protein
MTAAKARIATERLSMFFLLVVSANSRVLQKAEQTKA